MGAWFSSLFSRKKVPRPRFVEVIPDRGTVVYKREVHHSSEKGPYICKFRHPTATITGISCTPVKNEKIQSPEAKVKEGGLNWKYVYIYLEPQQEGEWAYEIEIRGEDAHETRPSQEAGSADGAGGGGDNGDSSDKSKSCDDEWSSETKNPGKTSSCSIL